jgi:hypothetical protein
MSKTIQIVSGAPNVTFTAPNKFTYQLPEQISTGSNDKVALQSLKLYYSWYNITAAKKNHTYSYTWVDGSTHAVTMDDGMYPYEDFQGYLEKVMYENGHYLTDDKGTKHFYITFQANPIRYRVALVIDPVPAHCC